MNASVVVAGMMHKSAVMSRDDIFLRMELFKMNERRVPGLRELLVALESNDNDFTKER